MKFLLAAATGVLLLLSGCTCSPASPSGDAATAAPSASPTGELLQAAMLDRLTTLCWMQSKDGAHGRKRPPSVVAVISGKAKQNPSNAKPVAFDTPADFERARARILKKAR